MSYWDGSRWVPEAPPAAARPRRSRRLLGAAAEGGLIALLMVGLVAGSTFAAKGGNGGGKGNGGNPHAADAVAGCVVDGTSVSATDLPTEEVVNFMVTESGGTWGWVLGFSGDGTWTVTVPDRAGPTTYEFASRTWGPKGTHYDVFASCSAG